MVDNSSRSRPSAPDEGDLAHALREEWRRVENLAAEQVRRALRTQFLAKKHGMTQPAPSDPLHVIHRVDPIHDAEPIVSKQDVRDAQPVLPATKIVARYGRTMPSEQLIAAKVLRKTTPSDTVTVTATNAPEAVPAAPRIASAQVTKPPLPAPRVSQDPLERLAERASSPTTAQQTPDAFPWRVIATAVALVSAIIAAFFLS